MRLPSDLPLLVSVLASSGSQTAPTLPGGIIAWIICNGCKRNAIGGWLLFYFWQLYSGLLVAVFFFAMNIQSYVPENFDDRNRFVLFILSAVPGLILLLIQTAIATLALSFRTPDMLKLLRWILVGQVACSAVGAILDAMYFPDNQVFSIIALVQEALWLAYLLKSNRVRHVFSLQDWDTAVNLIYPPKLKVST